MGVRRQGRVMAMQVLYQLDTAGSFERVDAAITAQREYLQQPDSDTLEADETAELEAHDDTKRAAVEDESGEAWDFAGELGRGVAENLAEIDERIQSASRKWRIARMDRVDRTLLRMAVYELYYCPEVPDRVAINEAVELAKAYGSTDSRKFVNGILDSLARQK
jgi:N utilization substance protein B